MPPLALIAKNFGRFLNHNSPVILTSVAVVGVASTAIMAVRATPSAIRHIEEYDLDDKQTEPRTKMKTLKLVWKDYIPATAVGLTTIGCIVGSTTVGMRKQAALISAYSITEKAFSQYQEKVVEQLGDLKEQRVRDQIAKDRVDANPPTSNNIIITGDGSVLCYDAYGGRYFQSSMEHIRRAENDINNMVNHEMYASLNEFYGLLGLPTVTVGEEHGFNLDHMLNIHYASVLTEDGRPCLSIDFKTTPAYYKISR